MLFISYKKPEMWLPTMQTQAVSEYLRKNENFPDTAHAFSYGVQVEFF